MSVFPSPVAVLKPAETREAIVETALTYRGIPYVYGGINTSGFDCSGFVYRVFLQVVGQAIPRTTLGLYRWVEPVSLLQIQKGDLVFFNTTGNITHVGIYIGDGRFVHSASEGPKTGVIISSLDEPYWKRTFAAAGQVVPATEFLGIYIGSGTLGLLGPSTNKTILYGLEQVFSVSMELPLASFQLKPGIELHGVWNYYGGSVMCPVTLSLGFTPNFTVFAGWPAIVGLEWEPLSLRIKKGPLMGGTLSIIGEAALQMSDSTARGFLSAGLKYTLGF